MGNGVRRAVAGAAAALVFSLVAHGQVVKPTFDQEFEKARTLLSRREYFEALKGFRISRSSRPPARRSPSNRCTARSCCSISGGPGAHPAFAPCRH